MNAFFLELYDLLKKYDATILISAHEDKYLCVSVKDGETFRDYRFNGDIDTYSLTHTDYSELKD